jgi:membrane protease YdiL (CAAX protease family)
MRTRSSSAAEAPATGAAEAGRDGRGRAAAIELGAAAAVLGYGVLINRAVPGELYVPVNLIAAVAAVGVAHALGVSWRDLGLARDRVRAGLRLGGITLVPIAAAVALGLAIPWTRDFFRDTTIVGASTAEAVYALLVRIPFGTALAEELIFRGALLGLYLRRRRPWVAVFLSSAVFGVWHVLPTLSSLDTNPGASAAADSLLLQAAAVAFVVLATGVAGAFFSWLRLRSGSILAPWLTHTGFNAMGHLGSRLEGVLSK